MPDADSDYRYRYPVQVRFRDLDPMGHVHHSLALVYFEEARAAYWRDVVGREAADVDYVLAEFAVRYVARIRYPQALEVLARVTALGRKSWTMEYELRSGAGEILASGRSVQVCYDYGANASAAIAPDVRQRIVAFEDLPS